MYFLNYRMLENVEKNIKFYLLVLKLHSSTRSTLNLAILAAQTHLGILLFHLTQYESIPFWNLNSGCPINLDTILSLIPYLYHRPDVYKKEIELKGTWWKM